jgi:hypothetical protein
MSRDVAVDADPQVPGPLLDLAVERLRSTTRDRFLQDVQGLRDALLDGYLAAVSETAAGRVSLGAWLEVSRCDEGRYGVLLWPGDEAKVLGLSASCIDRIAADPDWVRRMSATFPWDEPDLDLRLSRLIGEITLSLPRLLGAVLARRLLPPASAEPAYDFSVRDNV